jgi:hypothetical protein
VNGLRLKSKHAPGGVSDQIGHMPYSGEALRKSVTILEATGASLPAFEEGYEQWRSAFEDENAGVWTARVDEAIAGIESALNQ